MSLFITSCIINCVTCSALGLFLLIQHSRKIINFLFILVNASTAFFCFCQLCWQFSVNIGQAFLFWRLFTFGLILINISFIFFVFSFLGIIASRKKELFIYSIINIVFIYLNFSSLFYKNFQLKYGLGYWPETTIFFNIYIIFWLIYCLYGVFLLLRGMKEYSGSKKEQVKFFVLGSVLGTIGGAGHCFMLFGIDLSPFIAYLNLSISLYVGMVAYAIFKYRFLNIKITLSKVGLFLIIYTLTIGTSVYLGIKTDFGVGSFLFLFISVTLGSIIHPRLQNKATALILAQHERHHEIISKASQEFVKEYKVNSLAKLISSSIKNIMEIDFVQVLIKDEKNKLYKTEDENLLFNTSISIRHPLIKYFHDKKDIVFYDSISNLWGESKNNSFHLFLPIFFDNKLLSIIILGRKLNGLDYSEEDLRVFYILSSQISLVLHNSFTIEKNKVTQEKLLEAEKFSFIGGLAEGIARQIKSHLNFFNLFSAEIEMNLNDFKKGHQEDYQSFFAGGPFFKDLQKISKSLAENVKRTDKVLEGILNYAEIRTTDASLVSLSFDEIIKGAIGLARIKYDMDNFPLEVEVKSSNIIQGIRVELLKVFYTLIINACEAIEERQEHLEIKGRIKLTLSQEEDFSLISIQDNGIGMKSKDQKKIFAPYFSTKSSFKSSLEKDPSELGIGLYTVHRIITENHQGEIWFESEYQEGTVFYIKLPKNNKMSV